jgi:hypothetical protein
VQPCKQRGPLRTRYANSAKRRRWQRSRLFL